MNMNNLMAMIVAFLSSLAMILLTKSNAYNDGSSNTLFMILLLFAMVMMGLGIARLFAHWFGNTNDFEDFGDKK